MSDVVSDDEDKPLIEVLRFRNTQAKKKTKLTAEERKKFISGLVRCFRNRFLPRLTPLPAF